MIKIQPIRGKTRRTSTNESGELCLVQPGGHWAVTRVTLSAPPHFSPADPGQGSWQEVEGARSRAATLVRQWQSSPCSTQLAHCSTTAGGEGDTYVVQDSHPGIVSETQGNTSFVGELGHIAVTRTERVRLDETAELQGVVWKVYHVMLCFLSMYLIISYQSSALARSHSLWLSRYRRFQRLSSFLQKPQNLSSGGD